MVSFVYTPTAEDYISFEKFKYRKNKIFFFTYLFCVIFIAMALYDFFTTKSYDRIIFAAALVVMNIIITLYTTNIASKKRIQNMISNDIGYLTPNEVIIDEKTIEFRNMPQQNQTGIVAVYPYSIMNVIYETAEYYYFFLGTEVKLLAKRAIPKENKEYVEKIIKSNKNYIYA